MGSSCLSIPSCIQWSPRIFTVSTHLMVFTTFMSSTHACSLQACHGLHEIFYDLHASHRLDALHVLSLCEFDASHAFHGRNANNGLLHTSQSSASLTAKGAISRKAGKAREALIRFSFQFSCFQLTQDSYPDSLPARRAYSLRQIVFRQFSMKKLQSWELHCFLSLISLSSEFLPSLLAYSEGAMHQTPLKGQGHLIHHGPCWPSNTDAIALE
jgi:hypothetical protein